MGEAERLFLCSGMLMLFSKLVSASAFSMIMKFPPFSRCRSAFLGYILSLHGRGNGPASNIMTKEANKLKVCEEQIMFY